MAALEPAHDESFQHLGVVGPSPPAVSSPADPTTSFTSVVGSPRADLPASHSAPPLFPKGTAAGGALPLDMSLSSLHRPMDITPADVLSGAAAHERAASPTIVGGFSPSMLDAYTRDSPSEPPPLSQSSPATTSVSSYTSHTSSPAIPGLNSSYAVAPSSIASALDSMGLPLSRSRSGSSASPGHLVATGVDLAFPSSSSGPPTSSQGSGFQFPPSDFDGPTSTDSEGSSDMPGGPHLMVVEDMLKNIVHTANSARAACSIGNGASAEVKIDELKKTIALVAELIAATRLVDGPTPPSDSASPPHGTATRASPPTLSRSAPGSQYQQLGNLNVSPGQDTPDGSGSTDHESRKRCASSMGEDRVMKAMKLEPQDDSLMHPPSASAGFSFSSASAAGSLAAPTTIDPLAITSFSTNPPSAPSSRPQSSAGLTLHHQLNLYQPSHLSNPVPISYPPSAPLTLATTASRSSLDFSSPTAAVPPGSSIPSHITAFGHPPDTWPDNAGAFTSQSQSSGSAMNGGLDMPSALNGTSSYPHMPPFSPTSATTITAAVHQGLRRLSRSGSMSNPDPFAFTLPDTGIDESMDYYSSRPGTALSFDHSPSGSSPEYDYDDHDSDAGEHLPSPPTRAGRARGRIGSMDNGSGHPPSAFHTGSGHRRPLPSRPSTDNFASSGGHGNEVPQEYRTEVDRIFFEFLNKTCSNLDATDAKGEPIHQTLMAKKMQRLDESPDFRPFKFRIQAFTNAFLEELARQGYPEDKIPMKKIRNYLWNSCYISRFNEDGKKAKSKGNHIWNIEAKKVPEGGWLFRPFHRRLAGLPPGVAYVGLRWSWTPRIWDPQASRSNMPVHYSSPSLPSWLSWQDDQLSGVPPPDAQSCDFTVEARFMQDGQEEVLSQTVHINIAPMSNVDTNFSTSSRRPSLVGDVPRRIASDSIVPQSGATRAAPLLRTQTTLAPQPAPVPSQDAQVIQVLTTAAQRVAQEAQSQVVAAGAPSEPGHELQSLAKQQHVLTVTAQAVDKAVYAQGVPVEQPSSVLAAAAQHVVLQAARQVAADRSAVAAAQISAGLPAPQTSSSQVTVNEVSVATQTAVAQAVEIAGPLSSEVDVLMTASSLLQQQSRAPVAPAPGSLNSTQMGSALDTLRAHSTGSIMSRPSFSSLTPGVPVPPEAGLFSAGPPPIPIMDLATYAQHS